MSASSSSENIPLPDATREASPLVCIVIPAHNRRRLTLGCLDGLRWCARQQDWKIVVVDDASTDGTGEALRAQHPHVEIVEGTGDLFWTGAMSLGMMRGLELGCTEFIWLNDDTRPDETSLRRIAALVRENPNQMLASTALLDGKPQACCGLRRRRVQPLRGIQQPADVLAGYQVAFSAAVVRRIGLPDAQRWPHYGGDSSFTRTAHNAGFQLAVDGDSFVTISDAPPRPPVAEAFWRNDGHLSARIQRTFLAKKSPHRLLSLWHLDLLYRGTLGALVVFPARLVATLWHIITHQESRPAPVQDSHVPN